MDTNNALPVLLLFGPTASGKTELLERLFASNSRSKPSIPAEIISSDSMQIYRGMDIGTAKPDATLQARIPHHLIDIRNPDESFNVGDFVRLADEACLSISRRGALPVLSGGTGFYLKHFVQGLPETPPASPEIREVLLRELSETGRAPLLAELERVDPVSAARIHPNDEYRLLRALEVARFTGKPLSSFSPVPTGDRGRPRYRFLLIALEREREELYRRINARAGEMFASGLRHEVEALVCKGYGRGNPGLRAIGYQEFFLEDGTLAADDAAICEQVARNSRHYAKRQIVFFASLADVHWLNAREGGERLDARVRELLGPFLS